MDMQTLLNDLYGAGLQIQPQGDGLAVHGPVERLTAEHKQALRRHKQALRQLACFPYEQAEREAIQFADTPPAAPALARAIVEWDELTTPPPNCPQCGRFDFWLDTLGNARCPQCDTNQSARTRAIAERYRMNASKCARV